MPSNAKLKLATVVGNWAVIVPKTVVVPVKALVSELKLANEPKLATSNIKAALVGGVPVPSPLKFPVRPG